MIRFRSLQKEPGVLILVGLAALFGGISSPLVCGVFLVVIGLWVGLGEMVGMPAKAVIFWWGAFAWGCLALLPPWGGTLEGSQGLKIFQPCVSAESLLLFLAGLTWLTWWMGNPAGERVRLRTLRLYGILVAVLGLLALMAKVQRWPLPFILPEAEYGFFPNRNHMSNWLALGGMASAAAALADARKGRWPWAGVSFLAIAGILTCLAANSSRGGLLIFFLGILIWTGALTWAGPDRKLGAILLILTLLAATSLLFIGAKPLERMRDISTIPTHAGEADSPDEVSLDFRFLVFRDTLDLIRRHPFRGVGAGNFEQAFPPYRSRTFATSSTLGHPESDLFWLTAEYGLPALLLAFVGTWGLFLQAAPRGNREGWITRSACASSVAAFLLHGLMDVPGHRPGAVWAMLMMAGFAFARKKEVESRPSPQWFNVLLKIPAALVLLGGGLWLAGVIGGGNWPSTVAAQRAPSELIQAWRQVNPELALKIADRGLSVVPLDSVLRFLKGKTLLMYEGMEDQAAQEFQKQIWLQPLSLNIRLDQAWAWAEWAPDQPERAMDAYRGAFELAQKMPPESRALIIVLDRLSGACRMTPALRPLVVSLLESRPELFARWLSQAKAEDFLPALATLRAEDPELARW
ncbi:MAG: O-antigen ligase family protein, partial [Verrucomicrobia bacterium]|nr:O-antigen ligase family protein [Verrucomicrobiota bacterium]